jgi:(E)-4-hydroxy-3-methyl-but-2-enyl pyrophosphate reductase
MKIIVAKTAGFCFGVDRAVKTVYELIDKNEKVCTLGPIIHNPQIVNDLKNKGVEIVDDPSKANGRTLVIRSHGVPAEIYRRIKELDVKYIDLTCPFVANIHKIVADAGREGKIVLLAGDKDHPEVQGILGHCTGECYIFDNSGALERLLETHPEFQNEKIMMCSQTTFSVEEWQNCLKTLKKVYTNAAAFGTICNATAKRQAEAEHISAECDRMIVIGGRESSNTAKLAAVCRKNADTYLIESADELPDLSGSSIVGVTAGASTPAGIIKEVLDTMTEENKETQEQNFAEMLEESLKGFNMDERVHGVVVGITPTEVYVDVGRKQAGYIPAAEFTADPNAKLEDLVKIGDEMDLLIMKTNDQEGTIMLSKRRIDSLKGWDDIAEAEKDQKVLSGKVSDIVKGGLVVAYNGVRVFIPASQATANRGDDINELKGKDVEFKIIEVNQQRRRAVGSIRAVLRDERKAEQEKFWETAEEGQKFTGTVKSLTNFGAFVDLGGIDGMIHISELSWNRIKHPSEVVNVGDKVNVYIKNLDKEKKRISLGYKKDEDNPWNKISEQYPVGTVCDVTIVSLTPFGAFARIIPGIDGLIHISQISDKRIEKPQDVLKVGDVVKAKITEIDTEKKRISLSMKALLTDDQPTEASAPAADDEGKNETVPESTDEGNAEVSSEVKSENSEDNQN